MSQSASLTQALRAVERVIQAETDDPKVLAQIAGVDPSHLFFMADLTGVDLRNFDIGYLLPLETKFEDAKLTQDQLTAFRRHKGHSRKRRVRSKIQDLRAEAARRLVREYSNRREPCLAPLGGTALEELTVGYLESEVLVPITKITPSVDLIRTGYTNSLLRNLSPWFQPDNLDFFEKLFQFLGRILAPMDAKTAEIFLEHFHSRQPNNTPDLISYLSPSRELDVFAISESYNYPLRQIGNLVKRAQLLAARRTQNGLPGKVDAAAIERCIDQLESDELLTVFTKVPFECDEDQSERMASRLVRSDWPPSDTEVILSSRMPTRLSTAVFRQILAQGMEERIERVIRWLDGNKGAIGALSLENALSYVTNFRLAVRLATDLSPNLGANQLNVIWQHVGDLAETQSERMEVSSLRKRFLSNFSSRSNSTR